MAKVKTVHVCTECGGKSPRWQGQCPHCHAWNTLVESVVEPDLPVSKRFNALAGDTGRLQTLADIQPRESARVPTGIEEFDRVLGGGLVPGGVVLIGGDPGIGKSTLLLQALALLSGRLKALYVSGFNSKQVQYRGDDGKQRLRPAFASLRINKGSYPRDESDTLRWQ